MTQNNVLVVEDSTAIRHLLSAQILSYTDAKVHQAGSLSETKELLSDNATLFNLAVLDLNLPDAPNGEIVEFVQSHDIPVIVLTGTVSNDTQDIISKKNVLDYVIKRNSSEIEYVASLVNRILCNREICALVVDDSAVFRTYMSQLLQFQGFQTIEASDGKQALEMLENHPEVRLVITDYNMPDIDGIELIYRLRSKHSRSKLGIIGVSGSEETTLNARLLKAGANDILRKPFETEEFYCRVNHLMDDLDRILRIKEAAHTDFLTKLHNRSYLFEFGQRLLSSAKRKQISLCVAMIDIDHFKSVNDTYGHDFGDIALVKVAEALKSAVRDTDILVRFGGEEFCILAVNADQPEVLFERIRSNVENTIIKSGDTQINATISIGVTFALEDSLSAMISHADKSLYQAKENGRNQFIFADNLSA